jgi:histidinol dehydrogenase
MGARDTQERGPGHAGIIMIKIVESTNQEAVADLLSPMRVRDRAAEQRAARIVRRVREHGDDALRRYAHELDGLVGPLEVPRAQWQEGARTLPRDVRTAIRRAAQHIRRVARAQVPRGFRLAVTAGVVVEQRVVPLDRVGCYVPGGLYPLPSSLLMTAIPARVAGVGEVVAVCPRLHPAVLAAALEAGIDRLFQIGGAHAVAALAYGTRTVPRVDKIVGPGNKWVAAAKALVSADCSIDFYAGPTEILIVTNTGPARWIAADLLAQAEHDPDARAVMITTRRRLAEQVVAAVERLTPSDGPAATSLTRHGGIIVCRGNAEAIALANAAASEHVVVENELMASAITTAGALFVGRWTAQVAGDYAIGSNHVLPTAGAARFRGGLGAADFVRLVSVQRVSRRGLARIAPTISTLARAEGLNGHALSVDMRMADASVRS